jgi:hypothetical protein
MFYRIEKDMRGIALKAQLVEMYDCSSQFFTAFEACLKPTTLDGLLKHSEPRVKIHLKIDGWSLLFFSDGCFRLSAVLWNA